MIKKKELLSSPSMRLENNILSQIICWASEGPYK